MRREERPVPDGGVTHLPNDLDAPYAPHGAYPAGVRGVPVMRVAFTAPEPERPVARLVDLLRARLSGRGRP